MREFIIALILLSVILTVTVCNSIYVDNRIDEMLSVCQRLKLNRSALLTDELFDRWNDCRSTISLTTRQSDIERAENALLSLIEYIDVPADFNSQLALLISILEHIKKSQSFSFESIF